jgi:hypothetical protein
MKWNPKDQLPTRDAAFLVFMPERSLDRYSVQHFDHLDGWSNDFGITHWMELPPKPEEEAE